MFEGDCQITAAFCVTMLILHWLTTSHCLLFRSTQCHSVTRLTTVTLDHYHSINTAKSNPNSSCDLTSNYPTPKCRISTQLNATHPSCRSIQETSLLVLKKINFFLSNWWKYLQLMLVANLGGQTCQPKLKLNSCTTQWTNLHTSKQFK